MQIEKQFIYSKEFDRCMFEFTVTTWNPLKKIEFAKHFMLQFEGMETPRFLFDFIFICLHISIDFYKKEIPSHKYYEIIDQEVFK